MKNLKKLIGLIMIVVLSFSLVACGGWNEEDAQNYVAGYLDAAYKHEFSAYMKATKATEEEAQAQYDKNLEISLNEANFSALGANEEIEQGFRDAIVAMMEQAKYKVVEVKKVDKEFEVTVAFEPYLMGIQEIVANLETEFSNRIDTEAVMQQLASGEITEEDVKQMSYEVYLDMVRERIDTPSYGEEEQMVLHVRITDDGLYTIDEADVSELDSKMFVL
ncbi:hypothetical protein M2145_002730 [Lachnospiraceae bacterium PF1-21]|uniref:hypothetical protein n=1 Tax=Ohessyouella blattaphilus TaxID=2949333 RepID=UPI003E23E976